MEVHPERSLILSRDWQKGCYSFMDANDPSFRTWYGLHWASPKRQMQVIFPLCDFITSHYTETRFHFPTMRAFGTPSCRCVPQGLPSPLRHGHPSPARTSTVRQRAMQASRTSSSALPLTRFFRSKGFSTA